MGTNYYFMSRNKELMQSCFAEKSEWGVFGEEYTIVDEPYLGYRCHLNKLSCGWRPLFQKHRAFDSFRKLEAFYREHQADLEIYDEYRSDQHGQSCVPAYLCMHLYYIGHFL